MLELRIVANTSELMLQLEGVERGIPGAVEAGVRAVAGLAERTAAQRIGRIYSRSIPRSKSGRPLWTRSGDLQRGRETTYPTRSSALLAITGPAERYAYPRHELGVSWTPKNPAGGVIRRNPFFAETAEKIEPQVQTVFEAAFKNALGL